MMHPLKIRLAHDKKYRKLNFALSRVEDSVEKYRLLVCTYDAQWMNQCLIHQISVLPIQKKIQISSAQPFDMTDGMCSHQLFVSDDYIVVSCSKMFEDGSARKVRILSTTATDGSGHPAIIAEQSTPQYEGVMVSPQDQMHVLHHSPTETDVMYAVGSTIVEVKLVADASNVAWRTTINVANLCDDVGMLSLDGTDSILVVSAHGRSYFMQRCGYH